MCKIHTNFFELIVELVQKNKKGLENSKPSKYDLIILYFLGWVVAGIVTVLDGGNWDGVVGAVAAGGVMFLMVLEASSDKPDPPPKNKVERIDNIAIAAANIHVPFSKTSVVCLTPMSWLLKPPTFPANPPPLGFCINTIKPSTTDAITIKITNNVVI